MTRIKKFKKGTGYAYTNNAKYIVTGLVKGKKGRQILSKKLSLSKARNLKSIIEREVRIAIPKYKWARNLKIERVK